MELLSLQSVLRLLESMDGTVGYGSALFPKSELAKLKECATTISQMLLEIDGVDKNFDVFVNEIQDIAYELDDLLDEVSYQKLQQEVEAKHQFMPQVRSLFNSFTRFPRDFTLAQKLNKLAERMDRIILDLRVFIKDFKRGDSMKVRDSIKMRSDETQVCDIIGREADKKAIIDMLCTSDADFSFVSIVGMGGIGKTALAQLVYNDEEITETFGLRSWVCVSDDFDMKSIAYKIVNSFDSEKGTLEKLIGGKRYLFVLDDVWNEDPLPWVMLKNVLIEGGGAKGSMILVTTRSKIVARAIGGGQVYEMKGLSEEYSWDLFKRMAFSDDEERGSEAQLEIGRHIVKKCANVPLAIRVAGSLLYGQGMDKWQSLYNTDLLEMDRVENRIMNVLKLSYIYLTPPLKSCFAYLSLFPKNYEIAKDDLICLWIAQGYICPVDGDQTLEELGEDYFMILLQRSFFQYVKKDSNNDIVSCKMHHLSHDLAYSVAGGEILLSSSYSSHSNKKVRHFSVSEVEDDVFLSWCLPRFKGIRTFLNLSCLTTINQSSITSIFRCRSLRVLDLSFSDIRCLPDTLGELLHLRYIDLSCNSQLEVLPSSVGKLYNLQMLKLIDCPRLEFLPSELQKLVNLRCLNISGCNELTAMPSGLKNYTNLRTLPLFIVGEATHAYSDPLEDLKCLTKLRGRLTVKFLRGSGYDVHKYVEAGYLKDKIHLTDISLQWNNSDAFQLMNSKNCEKLLECLEPHPNLRNLKVKGYVGMRFPRWALFKNSSHTSSNIVNICLEDCLRLQNLPCLSKLRHLRYLKLYKLEELEYVESNSHDFHDYVASHSRSVESEVFFPSLKKLTLANMPKLKGWWRSIEEDCETMLCQQQMDDHRGQLCVLPFPRLSHLRISACPKLITLPACPNLKEVEMYRFSEALKLIICSSFLQQHLSVLTKVTVDNGRYISFLPVESYEHVSCLIIHLSDRESLSTGNEVFNSNMLNLQSLQIRLCGNLKSISELGWEHLAALQSLSLSNLPNLCLTTMKADGEKDLMPWNSLQSLRFLELDYLPKVVKLPKGIQYLTSLCTLEIRSCHNLEGLPEWISCFTCLEYLCIEACTGLKSLPDSMPNLTSLRKLEIWRCSGLLTERCQPPTGEDWLKIMHIPHSIIL